MTSKLKIAFAGFLLGALAISLLTGCKRASESTGDGTATAPAATASATVTQSPTAGAGSGGPTATPASQLGSDSPEAARSRLPRASVTFTVTAPEPPNGGAVYLMVLPFVDYSWREEDRVQLERGPGGTWTGVANLPVGSLVRYVYDRRGDGLGDFKSGWEAHGESVRIEGRWLLVAPGRTTVTDVVETWSDARVAAPSGDVEGLVLDAATGEPVVDANVSIGGLHGASNFDGTFRFGNVATGLQRITVFTTLGGHAATDAEVMVTEGGVAEVRLLMERAAPVDVTFEVDLPADTPPEAPIRIAGNVYQLGAQSIFPNTPFMGTDLPMVDLERVGNDRAVGTVRLHEGTYVQYAYSIGGISNQEWGGDDRHAYRELIVEGPSTSVRDLVVSWTPGFARRMTIRVVVPPNTPEDVPVLIERGPTSRMAQVGSREWVAYGNGFPGETQSFNVRLGGGVGDAAGRRSVQIGEADGETTFVVDQWEGYPKVTAADDGGAVETAFHFALPEVPSTSTPVLRFGSSDLAKEVPLAHSGGGTWTGSATLSAGGSINYEVRLDDGAGPSVARSLEVPNYSPFEVNDWVIAWPGDDSQDVGARPDYITGFYPPDFWSDDFMVLSDTTFESVAGHNGGWVALSSVWSYGTIDPLPVIESRAFHSPTVLTPRPRIVEQAAKARAAGLSVLLAPQFNMEMSEGGLDALADRDEEWWDAWAVEAEKFWMWNAQLSAEIGAEALLLPGYVFHVFSGPDFMPSREYFDEFDAVMLGLVEKVRGVYDGKILISGGVLESALPGAADLVGVTTYDTGHPDLPADAPLQEWVDAYEALFQERVDPKWQQWGVPVLFYTIHSPSPGGDRALQAKRLEAIFQVIERRPWIAGSFSWAYEMVGRPEGDHDGVRNRPAEAVLARWYGLFGGER